MTKLFLYRKNTQKNSDAQRALISSPLIPLAERPRFVRVEVVTVLRDKGDVARLSDRLLLRGRLGEVAAALLGDFVPEQDQCRHGMEGHESIK